MPYQSSVPAWDEDNRVDFLNMIRKKKQLSVAWFVSNCITFSRREKYVQELQKHIAVDIYGSCQGGSKCPRGDKCDRMLQTDYKFYLAFENSLCRDYVTEKFYKCLANSVVPVVYGGANYSALAPEKSFIDVHDFASAQHLADYLIYLDANQTAYEEYFQWRKSPKEPAYSAWCRLCEKLNDPASVAGHYDDIYDWWTRQSRCGEGMAVNASKLYRRIMTEKEVQRLG